MLHFDNDGLSKLDICHDTGIGGGGFSSSLSLSPFLGPCLARKKNGLLLLLLPTSMAIFAANEILQHSNISTLRLFDYSSAYWHPAGFFFLIAIARKAVAIWVYIFLYLLVNG